MRTPLEERRQAALRAEPLTRTDRIKWLWQEAVEHFPLGGHQRLYDAPDCDIVVVEDDVLGDILYQKITYGTHSVVECDGVVVCQLT
jgi:hypothetical protein